jgi:hypothetical protein
VHGDVKWNEVVQPLTALNRELVTCCTHLKGLTPECVNMCILRFDLFWNILPQRSQVQAPTISLWCTSFMWRCKAAREPRSLRQILHWNSRRTSAMSGKQKNTFLLYQTKVSRNKTVFREWRFHKQWKDGDDILSIKINSDVFFFSSSFWNILVSEINTKQSVLTELINTKQSALAELINTKQSVLAELGYHNYLDIRMLHLMCILAYLATSWTDLTI